MEAKYKIESFFSRYPSHALSPGETFLHAGDEPKGVYFLKVGHVRQYDISARTGTELTLHIFNPGSFFPLMWALNDTPNRYFYQSVGSAEVVLAPKQEVYNFVEQNPDVLFSLTKRLLYGLDGMILRLQNQVFGDAYTRTISELLYLGKHFGHKEGKTTVLDKRFTHQDIGDLTGAVRETVSVAMEKLIAKNLIRYEGRTIIINDQDQLEAELQKLL